jgi:hypothetical protein
MRRATALISLLAVVFLIAACGGNNSTEDMTDVEIAEAAIAAWNTADYDQFVSFFSDDGTIDGSAYDAEDVEQELRFFMALGDNVVVDYCDVYGSTEWIGCDAESSDDLSGPAGAYFQADWHFDIADGDVTSLTWDVYSASNVDFVLTMVRWLETAHPDVWEASFAAPGGCSQEYNCHLDKWYATPEGAAVILDFGPEFVAQSDEYSYDA